jgi:ribosomal protein L37AE/L43A
MFSQRRIIMAPEDIPEDITEGYPCPSCEEGSVTKDKNGNWKCDTCDFVKTNG